MPSRALAASSFAGAALLVGLAIACFVEPRLAEAAGLFQLAQSGLIFVVILVFHRAQRDQARAIDARLEEMRRLLRTCRAANEND